MATTLPTRSATRFTPAERAAALEGVIALAYHIAAKLCRGKGKAFIKEAAQCAMVGFCKAADKFDPSRGFKFVTYAYQAGWREVIRFLIQDRARGFHAPPDRNVPLPDVMNFGGGGPVNADTPLEHLIPNRPRDEKHRGPSFWENAIEPLSPRLRKVVLWRYRDGLTNREIGQRLRVTKQRAQQLIQAALDVLRLTMDTPVEMLEVG